MPMNRILSKLGFKRCPTCGRWFRPKRPSSTCCAEQCAAIDRERDDLRSLVAYINRPDFPANLRAKVWSIAQRYRKEETDAR